MTGGGNYDLWSTFECERDFIDGCSCLSGIISLNNWLIEINGRGIHHSGAIILKYDMVYKDRQK